MSSNCQTFLKFSEKQVSTKFQHVFCKSYTNFIHSILLKFLKNCFKNFQNFPELFPNIPQHFFQNFNKYYLKLILFKFSLDFLDSSNPVKISSDLRIFTII